MASVIPFLFTPVLNLSLQGTFSFPPDLFQAASLLDFPARWSLVVQISLKEIVAGKFYSFQAFRPYSEVPAVFPFSLSTARTCGGWARPR